jgi:uncharacterized membrane protein
MSHKKSVVPYIRAASVGAAAGLRSLTAPAAVFGANKRWRTILAVLAAGELIGDKLPQTPSRLLPPALIFRAIAGGVCGGEVAMRGHGWRALGIAAGTLAALSAAYVGYSLRRNLTEVRKLPGVPTAAVEDAIALLLVRFGTAGHST